MRTLITTVACLSMLQTSAIMAQTIVRSWRVGGGASPLELGYDPVTDLVWFADGGHNGLQGCQRTTGWYCTGFILPKHPLSSQPRVEVAAVKVDRRSGCLWTADQLGKIVYDVTPDGKLAGRGFRFAPILEECSGLALDSETDTLYVLDTTKNLIAHYNFEGRLLRTIDVSVAGVQTLTGLTYVSTTRTLLTVDRHPNSRAVFEMSRNGSRLRSWSLVGLAIWGPGGIDVDTRSGSVFVAAASSYIYELSGILADCPANRVVSFGTACADSNKILPQLACSDCPTVGTYLVLGHGHSIWPAISGSSLYVLGAQRAQIDLSMLQPGCVLWVQPLALLGWQPLKLGRGGIGINVPNDPALRGARIDAQELTFETGRFSATHGLEMLFQ